MCKPCEFPGRQTPSHSCLVVAFPSIPNQNRDNWGCNMNEIPTFRLSSIGELQFEYIFQLYDFYSFTKNVWRYFYICIYSPGLGPKRLRWWVTKELSPNRYFSAIFKVIKYRLSIRYQDHIWLVSRRHLSNMNVIWRIQHLGFFCCNFDDNDYISHGEINERSIMYGILCIYFMYSESQQ